MNCEPGDMAIVVGAQRGDDCVSVASQLCLGRIVRVTTLCSDGAWNFEETINLGRISFLYFGMQASAYVCVDGLPDSYLCPISCVPVTDDVTDEVMA
jgi:hypothetical protein